MDIKKKKNIIIILLCTLIAIVGICYFGYLEYEGYKKDGYFKYTIYDLDPSKKTDQELMKKIEEENMSEMEKDWRSRGIPDLPGFPGELDSFMKTYNEVARLENIYGNHYYRQNKPGNSFQRYINIARTCKEIPKSYSEAFTPKGLKCATPDTISVDEWGRPFAVKYNLEDGKICIKSYGRRLWNPWDDIEGCISQKSSPMEYETLNKLCTENKDDCPDGEGWK